MSKKVFMGGICGMGMCPLAVFLRMDGCEVCGFDDNPNPEILDFLKAEGVEISGCRIPQKAPDSFIITSALARKSEELKASGAKEFLRRGEALARICENRKLVAVCGSHGKTTTSALIAHAVNKANLDSGYMVGAMPSGFSPVKHCAEGRLFAAEIDESDATIENFSPHITVALNGDLDHTDTYPDKESLAEMFKRLFNRTHSAVIIPKGDALLKSAALGIKAKVIEVEVPQNNFLEYDKRLALSALNEMFDASFDAEIFDGFGGVARRQEILHESPKLLAIADYAHHPSEVEQFLHWLDSEFGGAKLLFFQPHRYTRTRRFGNEFKSLFKGRAKLGDEVWILPVYAASECEDPLGCSDKIADEAVTLAEFRDIPQILKSHFSKNPGRACAAFIGAGDVYFKAKEVFDHERF